MIEGLGKCIQLNSLFKKIYISYITEYWLINLVGRVFAIGLGYLGSILGRIIPKTLKMVLDTSLLNSQQCKLCIKDKVEQSRGKE